MKKQSWLKAHWKSCLGITLIVASLVVGVFSLLVIDKAVSAEKATLKDFTIVAGEGAMEQAKALYYSIAEETGVILPVTTAENFAGGHAIYVGTREYNSYGGYRYAISAQAEGNNASIYLDGSGPALTTATTALVDLYQENATDVFPFGITEARMGYEWNTTDATFTSLGYELNKTETTELAEGVIMMRQRYKSSVLGKVDAYVLVLKADSPAKLMAVAAPWDETNSVLNPVKLYTTQEYSDQLLDRGYDVLAICNSGYFKKAAGSNLPWGMQIIDGVVKQEPSRVEPKFSDNWVGVTKDGKYVISDTEGYNSTYKGNLQYAVGGQYVLMKDSTPIMYGAEGMHRTAVGLNDAGDLVIVMMDNGNYASILQVFMDLDMDIHTILNLDGGGSTTLYAKNDRGRLQRYLSGEGALERPVLDCLAIVMGEGN